MLAKQSHYHYHPFRHFPRSLMMVVLASYLVRNRMVSRQTYR